MNRKQLIKKLNQEIAPQDEPLSIWIEEKENYLDKTKTYKSITENTIKYRREYINNLILANEAKWYRTIKNAIRIVLDNILYVNITEYRRIIKFSKKTILDETLEKILEEIKEEIIN